MAGSAKDDNQQSNQELQEQINQNRLELRQKAEDIADQEMGIIKGVQGGGFN